MSDLAVRRHPDVAWVDSGDRIVILRLHRAEAPAVVLAGAAAVVWRALETPRRVSSLGAALVEVYAVSSDDAEAAAADFIEAARREGTVETVAPAARD